MNDLDNFYFKHSEEINGCLQAMKKIILAYDPDVTHEWKYGMPFFCYKKKMFCYLWIHKVSAQPYIGFVEGKHLAHALLIQEKRTRMKIMRFDPTKDLPIKTIQAILKQALHLYKSGTIKIKN